MSDTCSDKKYTYFVTGGGTGGHIYPAIAIADELKKDPQTEKIYYVGNPDNLEFNIAKNSGYDFLPVKVSGMPRKFGIKLILWFIKLLIAILKAYFYIKKYKPDAIMGTGGYVSAPALFAGVLCRNVVLMIHDSDAQPGIVSRYIAPYVDGVSLAFDAASKRLKAKNIHINGNPIRAEFKTLTKEQARKILNLEDKMTICIMGGSQGANSINEAAVYILERLSKEHNIQIIFQTGKKKFEKVEKELNNIYPNYKNDKNITVKPYFDNMTEILKASDIAVSRAGSLSLSELCACSIAAVLVPYPHAAADHQRKNAKFMVKKRAALYLEDADTTKDTLLIAIEQLLDNPEKINEIKINAYSLAKLDAVKDIALQLKGLIK